MPAESLIAGPPMLYRSPGCGSAMVEAAFALIDRPLELFAASRWDALDRLKALERVNPLGQVPTLVWPDGTVQTESIAILIEIALRWPDRQLLPSSPAERASALRWLLFLGTNIYAPFNPRDFPERWLPDSAQQQALVDGATKRIKAGWHVIEAHFEPVGPFAFGEVPGALDIAIAVMSRWTPRRVWFDEACPRLAALAHRVDAVPALLPVWADNFER